jgi:ABC-2 type transport system permease protein
MVVTIPADFERSIVRTRAAVVHMDVNAEKGSSANIVQSYATQILNAYAADEDAARHPGETRAGRITTVSRDWYNPTLNYKHYMVPGILVALVTIIGTLVTAQNIAREKEMGTLEQLNVTPITKAEFITAKLLPFWVLGLVDLAIGLLVGYLVFGVPMRGNPALLFVAAGVYLLVALGIGLWISTLVETQQQAMFVAFFVLMIYLLMSGLFTPADSMPKWVQLASELNPVRHFVTISRAILVKGAGFMEIVRPLGILVLYATAVLSLAVRQYDKRTA